MPFTANPADAAVERYLGGGKLYITPYLADGVTLGTEYELGEVKEFKLKIDSETKEAMSHDTALVKEVDEVVTGVKGSGSFSTQNISKENKALAAFGILTTEIFAIAAILPDGTTAAVETTIDKIQAGQKALAKVRLRFVGANATGTKKPVAVVFKANIVPDGDMPYQMEDFQSIGFSLKIFETAEGFYDEYLMTVA